MVVYVVVCCGFNRGLSGGFCDFNGGLSGGCVVDDEEKNAKTKKKCSVVCCCFIFLPKNLLFSSPLFSPKLPLFIDEERLGDQA